jgi:hypothetical protein
MALPWAGVKPRRWRWVMGLTRCRCWGGLPRCQQGSEFASPKGATYGSPGQRPGLPAKQEFKALKGRSNPVHSVRFASATHY